MLDSRSALPPILYLVHRIPYPPNKGDKLRSFNILRQLARTHRVFLGTFVDHPDDHQHVGIVTSGIHAEQANVDVIEQEVPWCHVGTGICLCDLGLKEILPRGVLDGET